MTAYVLSALGLVSNMASSVVKGKRMKLILFLVFFGNVMFAVSYLVNGTGMVGAAPSFLGAVCAIVTYFVDSKDRPASARDRRIMMVVYGAAFVAVNLATYFLQAPSLHEEGGIRALICTGLLIMTAMCFVVSIGQPNGAGYRFWVSANLTLFVLYDFVAGSYSTFAAHLVQLVVNLIGVYLYDKKKNP